MVSVSQNKKQQAQIPWLVLAADSDGDGQNRSAGFLFMNKQTTIASTNYSETEVYQIEEEKRIGLN